MGKSLDLQPHAQKGSDQGNYPTPEPLRFDHLFNQPSVCNLEPLLTPSAKLARYLRATGKCYAQWPAWGNWERWE